MKNKVGRPRKLEVIEKYTKNMTLKELNATAEQLNILGFDVIIKAGEVYVEKRL